MSDSLEGTAPARERLFLISVGVGDPDNITLRAHKSLAQADVVFCMSRVRNRFADLLAGKPVHEAGHGLFTPLARRDASDAEVDAMESQTRQTIRKALAEGKTVAILDYGDPCLYGPQAGYLHEFRDLDPVVIPGVSSFNAANAALATNIADGARSRSVVLTAARNADVAYRGDDRLDKLAETRSTMVIFTMGIDLPRVVEQLSRHYPADIEVALVCYAGEIERQSVQRATLATVLELVGKNPPPFEHLLYVGDFASTTRDAGTPQGQKICLSDTTRASTLGSATR